MTQKYYCDRLLPVFINAIHKARATPKGEDKPWVLQEDNDPSHGHKSNGLATRLKASNWIDTLVHPAQSPDLNPIEAICCCVLHQP